MSSNPVKLSLAQVLECINIVEELAQPLNFKVPFNKRYVDLNLRAQVALNPSLILPEKSGRHTGKTNNR
jgi:hypothetical protein